jgi:lipopolysaccharide export system permease protein
MTRKKENPAAVHTDTSRWRGFEWFHKGRRYGPTVIDRYVFVEILYPFAVTLVFWTSLFITIILKDVAGELLGKGISFHKILLYFVYLIGEKITETIPIACLFAGIMAAGRLSGDSEITAMRSAGISFPRIYSVFIFFGFLAMIVVGMMNLYLGPMNARAREDFEYWLKTYHSLTLVKPGKFMGGAKMDGLSRTGQDIYAENRDGDILKQVQIREWFNALDTNKSEVIRIKGVAVPIGDGFIKQIIHAESGELLSRIGPDGRIENFIRLHNGYVYEVNEEQNSYQMTEFRDGIMDYVIPAPVKQLGRLNVRPDNYTFFELFEFLERFEKGGNRIDVCALMPGCTPEGGAVSSKMTLGDESVKQDENDPNTLVLPGYSEMERMLVEMRMWLMQKGPKAGKPGGPTKEEAQQKLQMVLQFTLFLQDAEKTKLKFEVEIHKRLASPVASILFFFVAFPLGLVVKRSGKGMGFALALFIFFIYYLFLTIGLAQSYKGAFPPYAGPWLPDLTIAVIGIFIMISRTEGFSRFQKYLRPVTVRIDAMAERLEPLWKRILKLSGVKEGPRR